MAIPVITTPASPRIIAQGVAFSQAMAASNTPTGWAATGLPGGLTIHATTGTISGTPTAQGVSTALITATNGTGDSEDATIIFIVQATPPGMGGPFDIVLDYEMTTNEVTMPGVPAPEAGEPLFYAPKGTNRYLLVGVTYFGVLQDINPASEDVAIKLGMKELEPERLLEVTTAATVKVAAMPDDLQRYRIPFRVTPANWAGPLGDYEADAGTSISALTELQVSVGEVATLHDETLTDSSIAIEGGMSTPTTGDHDFGTITHFTVATPMRLTLILTVVGRVLQTVELVREFDLLWNGSAFEISNLSGTTTGQGAVESTQWRATLNLTGLAGDAGGVDTDYSITTTDETASAYPYVDVYSGLTMTSPYDASSEVQVPASTYLELWDGDDAGTDTKFGEWAPSGTYSNAGAFAAALLAGWETESGANDVVSVECIYYGSEPIFRVYLTGSAVTHIRFDVAPITFTAVVLDPTVGTPTTCSVAARLQQLEDPTSVPLNLTSNPFRIGVARDMVPD